MVQDTGDVPDTYTGETAIVPAVWGGFCPACGEIVTGKTKPPLALVKLLKVLERHPELLEEVR
ncbi:type II toxin-antitoxin system MqsA family antitoxin [Cupriavidus basilensis]|uniref:type II toxin-antitoxin system MqsA family antitoxin n=1 Tax=Cupriavidus basilensis TaxID=68895 RepID=UPI0005B84E63|nr:type II toxin-antitoxin system MqsA family antitoxin [Cupriavidus basilensis]